MKAVLTAAVGVYVLGASLYVFGLFVDNIAYPLMDKLIGA